MNLLILAKPGPAQDQLLVHAAELGIAEPRCCASWAEFMKELVAERPEVVALDLTSLSVDGSAALNAADMTLRALAVKAVIVVPEAEAERRFTIELETEFEHFFTVPGPAADLGRAFAGALGQPLDMFETQAPGPSDSSGDDSSAGNSSGGTSGTGVSSSGVSMRLAAGEGSLPRREQDPALAATVSASVNIPPAEPAAGGREDSTSSASAFFGPALAAAELREMTSRATMPHEAVPGSMGEFDDSSVSGMVDSLLDVERSGPITVENDVVEDTDAASTIKTAPQTSEPDEQSEPERSEPERSEPEQSEPERSEPEQSEPERSEPEQSESEQSEPEQSEPEQSESEQSESEQSRADAIDESHGPTDSPEASQPPLRSGEPSAQAATTVPRQPVPDAQPAPAAGAAQEPMPRAEVSGPAEAVPRSVGESISGSNAVTFRGESVSGAQVPIDQGDSPLLTISLPDPNGGDIAQTPVPQVIYSLGVVRATGELTLKTASLERRVVFFEGEPGAVFQVPTADDERRLLSTFSWTNGTYEFTVKQVPEAQFYTFGEPLELVFRGIQRHLGLNETATALGPYLKMVPVVTDQLSRFRRVLGLEGLGLFADQIDGETALEVLMMSAGAETEAMLRYAYYGWLTGVVLFADGPTRGPIAVQFEAPELIAGDENVSVERRPRTVTHSISEPRRSEALSPSGSHRAAGDAGSEHRETFERLGKQWDIVSTRGSYEIFNLQPKCGVDEVNRRFYELVREYHPDRYARIQNAQIRNLAEKIFVQIRNLHSDLLAREGSDDPGAQSQSAPGATKPSQNGESVADRRRRRATLAAASGASRRTTVQSQSNSSQGPSRPSTEAAPDAELSGGQSRKVGDVLNRLRTRGDADAGSPAASGASGRSTSTATLSSVRRLSVDQLLRNVKSATETGNFARARDLLDLAVARGAGGKLLDGYALFLSYTEKSVKAADALEQLSELSDALSDAVESSQALTLAGHICRLEEMEREALEFYKRASNAWSDNESAARWLRHLRRRAGDAGQKKPAFSSTFLNKLFSSKPK